MLYFFAIILPPVIPIYYQEPGHLLVNIILLPFLWFPASIHAILIVNQKKTDEKLTRLARKIREENN